MRLVPITAPLHVLQSTRRGIAHKVARGARGEAEGLRAAGERLGHPDARTGRVNAEDAAEGARDVERGGCVGGVQEDAEGRAVLEGGGFL